VRINPGVEWRKSFRFGVDGVGYPLRSGDPVIGSSGDRKGKPLTTEDTEEHGVNTLKSTDLHRCSQGRGSEEGKYNGD
jgi:hypothetical protein